MQEVFKPIKGYEGLYIIGNLGTVINLTTGKTLKQPLHHGYRVVSLRKDYKNTSYRVFQLLAKSHLDSYNEYSALIFLNGDRYDVRLENMYWESFYIEGEEWRNLNYPPYNEYYKVSSLGRLLRIDTNTLVKSHLNQTTGYLATIMSIKKGKQLTKVVHILVALTFIENPHNYKVINHIDGNKLNNRVDNLEYCNHKYNTERGWITKPDRDMNFKKVINNKTGEVFNTIAAASRETEIPYYLFRKMIANDIANTTSFKLYFPFTENNHNFT